MITMCSIHRLSTPTTVSQITKRITGEGFDAWLIEMVGGPNTDDTSSEGCGNACPNYTFNDLKDHYWPASIAGIQKYSGKNKIDYVGFSLGCSAALESLEAHQTGKNNSGYYFDYNTGQYKFVNLSAYPVDTFVGIGCPGNFTAKPFIVDALHSLNAEFDLIQDLKSKGKKHITMNDIKNEIYGKYWRLAITNPGAYFGSKAILSKLLKGGKMSLEIYAEFLTWMDNPNQPNLGVGVNLNKSMIIEGNFLNQGSDTIVPNVDTQLTCKNINSTNKYYVRFNGRAHTIKPFALPDDDDVQKLIASYLKSATVPTEYSSSIISTNQECN